MVNKIAALTIDEEIQQRQKLLNIIPEPVRSRIVILKAYPNEIVKRINQINGVLIEFEERL